MPFAWLLRSGHRHSARKQTGLVVNSRSRVGAGRVTQNFDVSPSGDAEIEIVEGEHRSDSIDLQRRAAQNLSVRLLHSTSIIVMLLASTIVALSDDLAGQASVIDGDTLEIHGTRIRLWGIDAPESSQLCRGEDSLQYQCGAKAANDLDAFIARRPVGCIPISLDRYGRTVASCSVGGADLGEWLVSNGLALDWPQYSRGRYGNVQTNAEQAGRGLWAGSYVEPWLYRVCIRAGGNSENCSDDANAHP